MLLSEPTSIADIGIVLGLPASPQRVADDLLGVPNNHEYAWMLARVHQAKETRGISHPSQIENPQRIAEGIWADQEHGPYVRAMNALMERCKQHQVAFANPMCPERASIDDLSLLSEQKRHVLIIAHWRGATIAHLHWLAEAKEVRERLGLLCNQLIVLGEFTALPKLIHAVENEADLATFTKGLNELIHGDIALFEMTDDELAAVRLAPTSGSAFDAGMLAARNRDEIDAFFGPELLSPGNRLELGSGFCTPNAINDCLSKHTEGVAFIACESDVLRARITHQASRRLWGRTKPIMPQGWLFAVAKGLDRVAMGGTNILTALDDLVGDVNGESEI